MGMNRKQRFNISVVLALIIFVGVRVRLFTPNLYSDGMKSVKPDPVIMVG